VGKPRYSAKSGGKRSKYPPTHPYRVRQKGREKEKGLKMKVTTDY